VDGDADESPLLKISDIAAIAAITREAKVLLAVDNTFMSPALQRPLELGADIVMHSTTKYIGGHSDVVGGFLAVSDPDLHTRLKFLQNAVGAVPGSVRFVAHVARTEDACGAHRGARAQRDRDRGVARDASRSGIRFAPEFADAPRPRRAGRQASGFGGVMSVRVRGGLAAARRVCRSTKFFFLAESLGGVESLIEHPAIMRRMRVDPVGKITCGLGGSRTTRLAHFRSAIERLDDLVEDLDRALRTRD
jgi:cystathionine beta-lyase/cystathionine gamma-synthase